MKKIRAGTLICALLLPLLTGMVSAWLSSQGMAAYAAMKKPPFSPPAGLFPIAWTILYLMMGLASYQILISETDASRKTAAFLLYILQLAMNFMWSIFFFRWDMYLFAFGWLMAMLVLVVLCTIRFFSIDKLAGYLMIPYILWLSFAAYLNLGAYILDAS